MKKLKAIDLKILLLFSLLFILPAKTFNLQIEITGIPTDKGNMYVAIYRSKDDFPVYGKQFKGKVVDANAPKTIVEFENLPEDDYSIAIYHDENKNNKLDKNMLGVPTECYGFSNNARRTFSAPSFSEAKFELKSDKKIKITVK